MKILTTILSLLTFITVHLQSGQPADTSGACSFQYTIVDSLTTFGFNEYEIFIRSDYREETVTHKWNLSNGLESDAMDPVFVISNYDSVVEVCHKMVDGSDIICEQCDVIIHFPELPPVCYADFGFHLDSTVNCNCLGVYQFYDLSRGEIISWQWSFGDGDTSYVQNPVHYYNNPGFYHILLEVQTSEGCYSTMVKHIFIRGSDECDLKIEYDVLESFPPQYQFHTNLFDPRLPYSHIPPSSDSTWFEIIRYNWDFGDGSHSTDAFPRHVYSHSGEYTVKLEVTYADGFICAAELKDTFTGSDQAANCDHKGIFYRNYQFSGYDVIFINSNEKLHVQQMIPKIYLPDKCEIRFGYIKSGDTLFIDNELFYSVTIPCIELLSVTCNLTGTVRDYTGLDGCRYLIELEDGTRIEPILKDTAFHFRDNQRVRLSYIVRSDMMSICMAGIIAEITCIEEIDPGPPPPWPYCEQIILNTSFILNGSYCSGTASIDIVTPCSAWMWYEMIMTTDYRILWSTGETTRTITGLCPGNLYFVNVTNPVTGRTYTAAFSIFQLNNMFPSWTFTREENTFRFNLPVDDNYCVTWEFDDGISLVGEDVSYTFVSGGNHQVELVVKDESGNEIYSETIQLSIPTVIHEQVAESMTFFPNPANNILYINIAESYGETVSMGIFSFSGQLLVKKHFSPLTEGDVARLDISDLKPGIYLLVMMKEDGSSQSIKFEKH